MFFHTETVVLFGALLPRNLEHCYGFPVSINVIKTLSCFAKCWLIKKLRLAVSDLYKTDSKTKEQLTVIQTKLKIHF